MGGDLHIEAGFGLGILGLPGSALHPTSAKMRIVAQQAPHICPGLLMWLLPLPKNLMQGHG